MDLRQIEFHQHPKWQLIKSSPRRLIYKSPYIDDELAAIELQVEGDTVYGLIKSYANPIGNRVIFGKGMPLELFLMLIVDVLAEDIFQYETKDFDANIEEGEDVLYNDEINLGDYDEVDLED